jgi:gliding motility-associated-like protein
MGFASSTFGYKFSRFGVPFIMPSGYQKLVLRIQVISSSENCGNDFAIDDIKLTSQGAKVDIAFSNELESTILKSVCFQQNRIIELKSDIEPYYATEALQWQQSTDGGENWMDIPGATSAFYSRYFSVPDSFLFWLSVAEADKITNPNCRVVSDILTVQVNGIPANLEVTSNAPVCAGQQLSFLAKGGATYEWFGPNGFYDNIPFPHIFYASLKDSGMYYADIISLGGCKARDSVYVKIIGTDVSAGNDTAICRGTQVTLTASPGISYSWTSSTGVTSAQTRQISVSPVQNTRYTVWVKDAEGCTDSASVFVYLRNATVLEAAMLAGEYVCIGTDSIYFTNTSSGNITNWFWDFGNGNISLEKDPPVQFYHASIGDVSFDVMLTVADSSGCTDSITHLLKVAPNCYIAVPTGFTPNNDGLNDYLFPLNAYKATDLMFRVYNRAGKLLFETQDWTKKWDGSFAGVAQPAGTYVWMLLYTDVQGKRVSLKGSTVLIR